MRNDIDSLRGEHALGRAEAQAFHHGGRTGLDAVCAHHYRAGVPRTALGFPVSGEHFEYHPTQGWQISVPNGYHFNWDADRIDRGER